MTWPSKQFPGVGYPTPTAIPDEMACRQVSIPSSDEWLGVFMGLVESLLEDANWQQQIDGISPADAVEVWQGVVSSLYASAERQYAACGITLPYSTRIEDGVFQTSVDGESWVDNPLADPRNQQIYPPPGTSDPRCDAAARVLAFFVEWVNTIVAALTAGADFFTLAGLLLDLLAPFMPELYLIFEIILDVAAALTAFSAEAIDDAFTTTVYGDLLCYLYCNCSTVGNWTDAQRGQVEQDITDNQDIVVAAVANFALEIMGIAGMNNQAFVRSETGDCSDCTDCNTLTWDFLPAADYTAGHRGSCSGDTFISSNRTGGSPHASEIVMRVQFPSSVVINTIRVTYTKALGTIDSSSYDRMIINSPNGYYDGTNIATQQCSTSTGGTWLFVGTTPAVTIFSLWLRAAIFDSSGSYGLVTISHIEIETTSHTYVWDTCP